MQLSSTVYQITKETASEARGMSAGVHQQEDYTQRWHAAKTVSLLQ